MRKSSFILIGVMTLGLSTSTLAFKLPFLSKPSDKKTEATTPVKSNKILLYKGPSTSTGLLSKLEPNTRLIPIYRKGAWTKVGNPENGVVGWVMRSQVQQVREAFYRPDIQTLYINHGTGKKGKPELNIIAYKNGKRLTPAEAKNLYKRIRQQQEQQMENMRRMSQRMNSMVNQQFYYNDKLFDSFWRSEPWVEPVIVFPDVPNQNTGNRRPNQSGALEG